MNFYKDGGDGKLEIPAINSYVPCTMLQLARVLMVEGYAGCGLNVIITRSARMVDDTTPEILTAMIESEVFHKFNRIEGKSFMVGQEYDEPPGIFTTSAIPGVSCAQIDSDAIVDLIYRLSVKNRASAVFLCNPDMMRDLRHLKDSDGRFLYYDAMSAGEPARLIGYPIHEDVDAPDNQLMFGNFRDGYTVSLNPVVTILRDPFSQKSNVLFYAYRRVGGQVEDDYCFFKLVVK